MITTIIPIFDKPKEIYNKYLKKLNDKPLFWYSLLIAKQISAVNNIIILTNNEEVELLAKRQGIRIILNLKISELSLDKDDVYIQFLKKSCVNFSESNYWLLLSPDAPTIQIEEIKRAVDFFHQNKVDMIYAIPNRENENVYFSIPELAKIIHSQHPVKVIEEGVTPFILTKNIYLTTGFNRMPTLPYFIKNPQNILIKSVKDMWIAEKILRCKKILFVVAGYAAIGMGHVYRALSLAHELRDHKIYFLCTKKSIFAKKYISQYFHSVILQEQNQSLEDAVRKINPDLVINDCLNTVSNYINSLKNSGLTVINFEDKGAGAKSADVVINALYESGRLSHELNGYQYFELRDEFLTTQKIKIKKNINNILITFGGTDRNDLSSRCLTCLLPLAIKLNIRIIIITGPGYLHYKNLETLISHKNSSKENTIQWVKNGTQKISEYMSTTDIAISSCGRTPYELAALGIPSIVIAANIRETLHIFPKKSGMTYLGHYGSVTDENIAQSIMNLLPLYKRRVMRKKIDQFDLTQGKNNILNIINKFVDKIDNTESAIMEILPC